MSDSNVFAGLLIFLFVIAACAFISCVIRILYLTWVWDSLHIWMVCLGGGVVAFILGLFTASQS